MVTVRRIRSGDWPTLRQVRLAALADAPSAFGSTHDAEAGWPASEWEERAAARAIADDQSTWFAVDETGDVLGLVGAHQVDGSDVELVSMWTSPGARRRGVGRMLIDTVVDWARERGAPSVSLWVTRGNDPAQHLYERAGFVGTGDHQPLPSDPCKDEIRMTLPL